MLTRVRRARRGLVFVQCFASLGNEASNAVHSSGQDLPFGNRRWDLSGIFFSRIPFRRRANNGCEAFGSSVSKTRVMSNAFAFGSTEKHSSATHTCTASVSPFGNVARNVAKQPTLLQVEQLDNMIDRAISNRLLTPLTLGLRATNYPNHSETPSTAQKQTAKPPPTAKTMPKAKTNPEPPKPAHEPKEGLTLKAERLVQSCPVEPKAEPNLRSVQSSGSPLAG